MDIDYVQGTSTPGLPKFIIVDFGTDYRGPTFFLGYPNREVWVPINPITDQWYTKPTNVGGNFEEHTRTMIPLWFFLGLEIWKAQVQTI